MEKQKISKNNDKLSLKRLEVLTLKEKKIMKEINSSVDALKKTKDLQEKKMLSSQLNSLKKVLKKTNSEVIDIINSVHLAKPLVESKKVTGKSSKKNILKKIPKIKPLPVKSHFSDKKISLKDLEITDLEKETVKRIKKKKEKKEKIKSGKPNSYVKYANKLFSKFSQSVDDDELFVTLKKDLMGANLEFIPTSYISIIFFTTLISFFVGLSLFLFFLFFNFSVTMPMITRATEEFGTRLLKTFWLIFVVPLGTFFVMFFYPSLEKKATETGINQELPFATIHMSAISGSMIDPTKIFSIIISTNEYPFLEKEFTKLLNDINIYGHNLEGALRDVASKTASKKLAELFNGLAVTITSGGDLANFFEKRAESLLFEHKIEREKHTKSAETFMDIYISVVIAAPMIFMLLLLMMKISGFGINLSIGMITLLMVLGVSFINIVFLVFLHIKQPSQ